MRRALINVVCGGLLLLGCLPRVPIEQVGDSADADRPRVVVLWSRDSPIYKQMTDVFVERLGDSVSIWRAELSPHQRLLEWEIERIEPDLIYTLGSRATLFARREFTGTPVLFSAVVDHRRHEELDREDVMGVSLEMPAYIEFGQFKLILPTAQRVLAFYTDETSTLRLETSRAAMRALGLNLRAVRVEDPEELEQVFVASASNVDMVWFFDDPVLMNPDTFDFLKQETLRRDLPLVCSLSRRFTEAGALMSISVDFDTVAFQAASLARQHLIAGREVKELGVQDPVGSEFVVNINTADAIGVDLPPRALHFVDEIIGFSEYSEEEPDPIETEEPAASDPAETVEPVSTEAAVEAGEATQEGGEAEEAEAQTSVTVQPDSE